MNFLFMTYQPLLLVFCETTTGLYGCWCESDYIALGCACSLGKSMTQQIYIRTVALFGDYCDRVFCDNDDDDFILLFGLFVWEKKYGFYGNFQ
jgi:hypothetical protein